MASMNLMLHVGAAVAFAVFGYWIARQRADILFLRRLTAAKTTVRVSVTSPSAFVRAYARALGIACDGDAGDSKPVRVDLKPWAELLSVSSPRLLRWSDKTLTIVVAPTDRTAAERLAKDLSQAMGGTSIAIDMSSNQSGVRHAEQH